VDWFEFGSVDAAFSLIWMMSLFRAKGFDNSTSGYILTFHAVELGLKAFLIKKGHSPIASEKPLSA
jgi:hypothetical protein